MKTKITLCAVTIAVCSSAMAATLEETKEVLFFKSRITGRTSRESVNTRTLPAIQSSIMESGVKKNSTCFIGWNETSPSNPILAPEKENAGEKMDSIVGHYLDGKLMSKQTFEYTQTGRPKLCTNYTASPDGKTFISDGYYEYEYDNLGRTVTATKVSLSSSSMRIEYIYDGSENVYSVQIAYLPDAMGEWIPYQKGEYQFDTNFNTTQEVFYLWADGDVMDWVPVMKNDASYDEMNRLTSYFPYVWDSNSGGWAGNKSGAFEGQAFEYTQNGDDARQIDYTWENNAWLEYKHTDYTYNDAALLITKEELYWNRDKQDWSGGDGYGEWGDKKYNSKGCYEYDEYGRVILHNFYRKKKTDDYVLTYRVVNEYNELADGEIEKISTDANIASDGTETTGRRVIERYNRFGGETYYAILKPNDNGVYEMTEEEVRTYMPGYKWYLGYESFRYDNGEKIPVSKEEFLYGDDFNPEAGYETPYEGRHYVRTASGLTLKTIDSFTWGPRDVMTEYVSRDCLSGTPLKVYGWDVEYDFSADCSNIFMWPDGNKGDVFYENKNISSNEYYNPAYTEGSDEWNPAISSHFDYFYSPKESSSIETASIETEKGEIVEIYDLLGHRIKAPKAGINIIVYSNGTIRKIIVRE